MPEVVTKYPAVLIKELKDAGGICGEGYQQKILTTCPKDKFCRLPTGEICIYDYHDLSTMTQINSLEWHEAITNTPGMFSPYNLIVIIAVFGLGLLLGNKITK